MRYPEHLLKLISVLKKFPGVGTKTAERFAFHLLDWPEEKLSEMALIVKDIKKNLKNCPECGALVEKECLICTDKRRNREILCVTASAKDIFLIEETREYRGLYHVLGALFSPIDGHAPPPGSIEKLKARIEAHAVKEIIIALDSTLEGDTTALYLKRELVPLSVSVSRLALGLPMGSSLDFIDGGTLARALAGRHTY
ncbi:MAG: recombination protein RecR [Chlamydiales bacterium]|nr:recombination protein RecR [Chlamydiales bacterium]